MSDLQPLLAVVIPTYGHPALTPEAIESVLRQQTPFAVGIVLVNDGCPLEQTHRVCSAYAHAYPGRVFYARKRNGGLSSARNRGVQVALAAWPSVRAVYFLDADNRLHPHFLARAWALLEANPHAAWAFADLHMAGSSREWTDWSGPFRRLQLLAGNYCDAGSLVRREVFEHGLAFDEQMRLGYEDWDFWLQAAGAGLEGVHGRALGFVYRKRPESMLANSQRDHEQILAYLRKKHARLYAPRHVRALEQRELPRFALYLPERGVVVLTSAPSDRTQAVPWGAFAARLPRWRVAEALDPLPPTFAVARGDALDLLADRGVLANLLWLAERDLEGHDLALLSVRQRQGTEVRLELTAARSAAAADARRAVLCVLPTRRLADVLADPAGSLEALPRRVARRLVIEHPAEPRPLRPDALARLRDLVTDRPAPCGPSRPPLHPARRFMRPACDAVALARHVFRAPPGPPLPLAAGERHLGLVLPLSEFGGVERVTHNLGRQARRAGWHTHLFVVGAGRARLLAEFADAFDSIHLVPDDHLAGTEALVSLLGDMDVVLNNHCLPAHQALGELRRRGVKLQTQLHLVDLSAAGVPGGYPYLALDYEHCLHRVLVISGQLERWLTGRGLPAEKVLRVGNAPSFHVSAARLAAVMSERRRRGPDEPLRVLFLARFDRQKGLDRLAELVRRGQEQGSRLSWRVVGKGVLSGGESEDWEVLRPWLRPAALDAAGLVRHYGWADVLVLVSRYEGVPLAVLEAQQLGCVPLAVESGAVAEVVEDGRTGYLFANEEPAGRVAAAVLDRLEALQCDRGRLLQLAEEASARRRGQGWEETTRDWLACLESWCPAGGGR